MSLWFDFVTLSTLRAQAQRDRQREKAQARQEAEEVVHTSGDCPGVVDDGVYVPVLDAESVRGELVRGDHDEAVFTTDEQCVASSPRVGRLVVLEPVSPMRCPCPLRTPMY